jgi:hypothetical protein
VGAGLQVDDAEALATPAAGGRGWVGRGHGEWSHAGPVPVRRDELALSSFALILASHSARLVAWVSVTHNL